MPQSDWTPPAIVGAIASVVSALIAIYAARVASVAARAAERSSQAQERALSLEARKLHNEQLATQLADIAITFGRGQRGFPAIEVTNHGPAIAYDLTPTIDGIPFADSEDILISKGATAVIAELPVGSTFRYDFFRTAMTSDTPRKIRLTWRLASGEVDSREAVIQP